MGRRRHRHAAARGSRRAAARRVVHRPRRHRRARRVDAAADVAVLRTLPRVRGSCTAAAASPPRSAHATVAAASACRRPPRGGGEVPDVPDPARDVPRVPPGRVRRAGPARGARPASHREPSEWSASTRRRPPRSRQSLLFNWIAAYMYEGDAPLAERRAAALALDRDLLRDLLGAEELRELLDPGVLADVELELQCLVEGRRARSADELHDVLRKVGDLTAGRDRSALRRRRVAGVAGRARARTARDRARCRRRDRVTRPPRTPPGIATRSDARSDSGCRWRSPNRSRGRSRSSSAGTRARMVRSSSTTWRAASARRPSGWPARSLRSSADDRVVHGEFRPDGVQREWCDVDVLRQLRRRSLAALRREVEPVEPEPTPGSSRRGTASRPNGAGSRRSSRRSACCRVRRSSPRPLETDVLPARVRGYRAAILDELCTSGELVWVGAGAIGADRRADPAVLRRPAPVAGAGVGTRRGAERAAARRDPCNCCASAAPASGVQLRAATARVHRRRAAGRAVGPGVGRRGHQRLAGTAARGDRRVAGQAPARELRVAGRPRPGRLTRIGPPAGAGRWSLVAPLLRTGAHRRPRRRTPAPCSCIERYGVVTREAVLAEGVVGGFAGVYGVLKVLEERGQVRRGYFVAGLGAAQFALPGRRRSAAVSVASMPDPASTPSRCRPPLVLAATDPAQPYGAALGWPESPGRPARSADVGRGAVAPARRWCGSIAAVASPRHVPRVDARPELGRRAGDAGQGRSRPAASRSARSTAGRWTTRSPSPCAPPGSSTATAGSSYEAEPRTRRTSGSGSAASGRPVAGAIVTSCPSSARFRQRRLRGRCRRVERFDL